MIHRFHHYHHSKISYYTIGNGSKSVICFHGYGEDASSFHVLEQSNNSSFTFYLIELPFHGRTEWNTKKDFEPRDLVRIIEEIVPRNASITLVGYSLGGRIALALYEVIHSRVDQLLLIAPDGLKVNPWYWLATQNGVGNRLFKFTMDHPKWFFIFLKGLNRLGLVNTSIFKFVNFYIGDHKVREDLYNRWTRLKQFRPDIKKIKSLISESKINTTIVYGIHDKIILPARGEKFRSGIEKFCEIKLFDSGHRLLESKFAAEIFRTLKDHK